MPCTLRANLWLLVLSILLCCVILSAVMLFVIGQSVFPIEADGSLIVDDAGQADRLAADRPAVHGRRVFSSASLGRVVQRRRLGSVQLGRQQLPAPRPRRPAARSDRQIQRRTEDGPARRTRHRSWFQQDQCQGKPGIVAQWAAAHPTLATNWVKADPPTPPM